MTSQELRILYINKNWTSRNASNRLQVRLSQVLALTSRKAMVVSRRKLLEMAGSEIVTETALGTGEINGQKLTSKWRDELLPLLPVGLTSQESIWTGCHNVHLKEYFIQFRFDKHCSVFTKGTQCCAKSRYRQSHNLGPTSVQLRVCSM